MDIINLKIRVAMWFFLCFRKRELFVSMKKKSCFATMLLMLKMSFKIMMLFVLLMILLEPEKHMMIHINLLFRISKIRI